MSISTINYLTDIHFGVGAAARLSDLLSSLDLALDAIKSTRRKARMELVSRDVRAGESLADSLEKSDVLTATGRT